MCLCVWGGVFFFSKGVGDDRMGVTARQQQCRKVCTAPVHKPARLTGSDSGRIEASTVPFSARGGEAAGALSDGKKAKTAPTSRRQVW